MAKLVKYIAANLSLHNKIITILQIKLVKFNENDEIILHCKIFDQFSLIFTSNLE